MAIDDNGNKFELSPDPMLTEVCPVVADIKLGDSVDVAAVLKDILGNKKIWGVDLHEVGMAPIVCDYFAQMIAGPGAVAKTLEKYV